MCVYGGRYAPAYFCICGLILIKPQIKIKPQIQKIKLNFFIYNLFVYVKNGSIGQKWGVIENVNKLHQATVKLRLVKILEILGQGASYSS